MAATVKRPSEKPLKNKNYFNEKVASLSAAKKEQDAKWYKDNPGRTPGWNPSQTWKTFSPQRHASKAFRDKYDSIDWSNG
jgi:hypothetical protein